MTDQTPRVPDLWWSPTLGILRKFDGDAMLYPLDERTPPQGELPSDAVKLEDIEAAEVDTRNVVRRSIQDAYDAGGFDWHDIPPGHFNRVVKIVANLMVARADAAEAKLAGKDGYVDMLRRQRGTAERERDEARAKLAEMRKVLLQGGQDAPSVRRQAIALLAEPVTDREEPAHSNPSGSVEAPAKLETGSVAASDQVRIRAIVEGGQR